MTKMKKNVHVHEMKMPMWLLHLLRPHRRMIMVKISIKHNNKHITHNT